MTNKEMRTKMRAVASKCDALADEAAFLYDARPEASRVDASVSCVQAAVKLEQTAKLLRRGAKRL